MAAAETSPRASKARDLVLAAVSTTEWIVRAAWLLGGIIIGAVLAELLFWSK